MPVALKNGGAVALPWSGERPVGAAGAHVCRVPVALPGLRDESMATPPVQRAQPMMVVIAPPAARCLRPVLASLAVLATLAAGPAAAEQASYALRLAGFRLATLTYAADGGGSAYGARLRFETSGLAGVIAPVRFEAEAQGRTGSDGGFRPQRYREQTERGGETEVTEIVWNGARPRIVTEDPPQPDRLDPARAEGSVDLMTGMHALFRPVAETAACRLDLTTYDGKRLTRMSLGPPRRDEDGRILCDGRMERLAGVPPEGMMDMMAGGFTVTYGEAGEGRLRVTRLRMRTPAGPASFVLE